ncbi:MAG: hypothetical protein HY397_00900, partial [Candidatus Doudnabacteria bacterium]|nr:hypothetical protein [Candidatus Doudnabacteria bacterium]
CVGGYFVLVRKPATPSETQQPITPQNDTTVTPTPPPDTSIKTTPPSGVKTATKVPTSPIKLDAGAPAPPADQALAEITVLSQVGEEWKVRVDKIRDYIRYPAATNPQLKVGDTISIRFNGWLDTFQSSDKVCPAGYIKSPKPTQAESTTQLPSTRPQPQITAGQKYLSKLFGCFAQANCQTIGWSGWLYNPSPTVIEYECVKPDTTTPPSTKPQDGPPSVEPQQ